MHTRSRASTVDTLAPVPRDNTERPARARHRLTCKLVAVPHDGKHPAERAVRPKLHKRPQPHGYVDLLGVTAWVSWWYASRRSSASIISMSLRRASRSKLSEAPWQYRRPSRFDTDKNPADTGVPSLGHGNPCAKCDIVRTVSPAMFIWGMWLGNINAVFNPASCSKMIYCISSTPRCRSRLRPLS